MASGTGSIDSLEAAWLRVKDGAADPKYGPEQDQAGIKWRFLGDDNTKFAVSIFPQFSFTDPDTHGYRRGINPPGASLLLPIEFTRKVGPIDVNWEVGYNLVHLGHNGWEAGLVIGHDVTKNTWRWMSSSPTTSGHGITPATSRRSTPERATN